MEPKIGHLQNLFDARSSKYDAITRRIFSQLSHVLEGALEFLTSSGKLLVVDSRTEWDTVNLIENHVIIEGWSIPNVGAKAKVDNKEINVTENTVDYFTQRINVVIPVEIAATGKSSDVVNFLHQLEQEQVENASMWNGMAASETDNDFDFEEVLTEEQLKNLHFNTGTEH